MARRSEWGKVFYSKKHRSLMINRYVGDRKPYRKDIYFITKAKAGLLAHIRKHGR